MLGMSTMLADINVIALHLQPVGLCCADNIRGLVSYTLLVG